MVSNPEQTRGGFEDMKDKRSNAVHMPTFHPNAPKRLIKLWKKYPAYNKLADHLEVNVFTVWQAMKKGKEPKNKDMRQRFGLPRKEFKKRTYVKKPIPQYIKWWRGLDPIIRNMYIKETFETWTGLH